MFTNSLRNLSLVLAVVSFTAFATAAQAGKFGGGSSHGSSFRMTNEQNNNTVSNKVTATKFTTNKLDNGSLLSTTVKTTSFKSEKGMDKSKSDKGNKDQNGTCKKHCHHRPGDLFFGYGIDGCDGSDDQCLEEEVPVVSVDETPAADTDTSSDKTGAEEDPAIGQPEDTTPNLTREVEEPEVPKIPLTIVLPLKAGSPKPLVGMVQSRLVKLGYLKEKPTGLYTKATKIAVYKFQRARLDIQKVKPGLVDFRTWNALGHALER